MLAASAWSARMPESLPFATPALRSRRTSAERTPHPGPGRPASPQPQSSAGLGTERGTERVPAGPA